jgi:hypothetical protein
VRRKTLVSRQLLTGMRLTNDESGYAAGMQRFPYWILRSQQDRCRNMAYRCSKPHAGDFWRLWKAEDPFRSAPAASVTGEMHRFIDWFNDAGSDRR